MLKGEERALMESIVFILKSIRQTRAMYTCLLYAFLLFDINYVVSRNPLEDFFGSDELATDVTRDSGRFQDGGSKSHFPSCPRRQRTCEISSPVHDDAGCKTQRLRNIQTARKFYKLTTFGRKKIINFPLQFVPFLNQTLNKVKFVAALDPVDSQWLVKVGVFIAVVKKFMAKLKQRFGKTQFADDDDYKRLFDMHNMMVQYLNLPQYFSSPALSPTFTDIIHNGRYKSDEVFVQQRLAGPCPFLIKLVTKNRNGMRWSELSKLLNPNYDFDTAISSASTGLLTLDEAVRRGRLYVLYHPDNNGIRTVPDYFDPNHNDGNTLINVTSPIALFATTCSGDLKVVAIQIDYLNTSPVYSPDSDNFMWSMAKSMVNVADGYVCQARWHLSHLHLSGTTYCVLYKSHLSDLHPLHEVMKYHCEGTTPQQSLTSPPLLLPGQVTSKIYSIGLPGFTNLTVTGFKKFRYGLLDYDQLMRSHGLNSRKITYYPFRDDGEVIWKGFKRFAREFVHMYYNNDTNVQDDWELQSFADQVSIDGVGDSYGGKANIIGFPTKFKSRRELETFVTRFLWQIALHATINYPKEPWFSFIPLEPQKLYNSYKLQKTKKIAQALPGAQTTFAALEAAMILGNFRVNRIFDYYDKVRDVKLGELVSKYHHQFHGCIQKLLAAKNKKRKLKKQMGYQYLEPKWMTNSIHV